VGGLAHIIERSGVATTHISLIREHTAAIKPPRALWVPFELGRPLGAPNDPDFQLGVLRAALGLLARTDGPVLEDYPLDAPASEHAAPWACPVQLPAPEPTTEAESLERAVLTEIRLLHPWYDESQRARHRTAVGVSGKSADAVEEMATLVAAYAAGADVEPQGYAHDMPVTLKYVLDDLKAFYFEAALAQPGRGASSRDLNDWFFRETVLGSDALYRVAERLGRLGGVVVPAAYRRS
jgi:hypothetical protein